MNSIFDILRPSVVTRVMNEIRTPYDRFQEHFRMLPGSPELVQSPVRSVTVDIANDDRTVSNFSAPGSDATVIAPMAIGNRGQTAPRTFERMDMPLEKLNQLRAIGQNAGTLDPSGRSYLRQQMAHMKRRTSRFREFLLWGMQRGSTTFTISNDQWIPVASGGNVTLDWQMPSTHKNQLNSIIDASWDTASTNIISHLGQITAFSEQETGLPIRHAWCNAYRWAFIANNTQVRNLGGTASTPWEIYEFTGQRLADYGGAGVPGSRIEHRAILKGYPSITWHITDRGIKLNGTYTKFWGNDEVGFQPEPDSDWVYGWECKEATNQQVGADPVDVYGYAAWMRYLADADTPKMGLYSLDNFLPCCNPSAMFFADVTP